MDRTCVLSAVSWQVRVIMASDMANPRLAGKEAEPRRSVARSACSSDALSPGPLISGVLRPTRKITRLRVMPLIAAGRTLICREREIAGGACLTGCG